MAKEKVEQELTVEEKLRALYELQTVNSKIDSLRILEIGRASCRERV